ncbi:MAG: adenylosuccinate synthetase, partial [Nanoarchaeota archaeon]|nr:adenylosuccinate synthetase [Nanoarchaeota archaeon]
NLKDKLVLLDRVDRNVLRKIMQHDHLERGIFFDQKSIFDVDAIIERYSEYGKRLEPLVSDVDAMVREAVADGMKILLEGAQGHMLSIDYGSYPFVTSSDCSIPGLAKGSGLSEKAVDSVLGVVKAPYMTRVGEGPFPTEMGGKKSADWCSSHTRADEEALVHTDMNHDDPFRQGVAVRIAGGEYGATTGRPRRTGWLDLPLLRAAMLVNGNQIALTKLQVFDGAGEVRICDSYTYNGPEYFYACQRIEEGFRFRVAPSDVDVLQHCEPNYVTLPGWKGPTENIRSYEKLPKSLRNLVGFVEANTGARVRVLSMGPERSQTIVR